MLCLRATCLYPLSTPSGGTYPPASVPMRHECSEHDLKGNSHRILLSEMSLPGVEVVIEKLRTKILGRLGKENPSIQDEAKMALYSASVLWHRQFRNDFCTLHTTSQVKISACAYACRAAVNTVRYVYAFRNYLSEFLRQSSTPVSAVWRHTTLQSAFWEPSRLRI